MNVIWNKQMDDVLLNLLNKEGMTYKKVAELLSIAFGVKFTKNSCIGRAKRLRMPPITILELREGVCHWPLAKVEDYPPYIYCGKPTVDLGCSWCQAHADEAFGKTTYGNAKIARPVW
jgi:hypothetical protein